MTRALGIDPARPSMRCTRPPSSSTATNGGTGPCAASSRRAPLAKSLVSFPPTNTPPTPVERTSALTAAGWLGLTPTITSWASRVRSGHDVAAQRAAGRVTFGATVVGVTGVPVARFGVVDAVVGAVLAGVDELGAVDDVTAALRWPELEQADNAATRIPMVRKRPNGGVRRRRNSDCGMQERSPSGGRAIWRSRSDPETPTGGL